MTRIIVQLTKSPTIETFKAEYSLQYESSLLNITNRSKNKGGGRLLY